MPFTLANVLKPCPLCSATMVADRVSSPTRISYQCTPCGFSMSFDDRRSSERLYTSATRRLSDDLE